jgi:hypothetical protein
MFNGIITRLAIIFIISVDFSIVNGLKNYFGNGEPDPYVT